MTPCKRITKRSYLTQPKTPWKHIAKNAKQTA